MPSASSVVEEGGGGGISHALDVVFEDVLAESLGIGDGEPAPPPAAPDSSPGGELAASSSDPPRRGRLTAELTWGNAADGYIRYYATTNQFVAECRCPDHMEGKGCFLTRSCTPRAALGGRSLGFLLAWLRADCFGMDKADHVHRCKPSHDARLAARMDAVNSGDPQLASLLSKECRFEVVGPTVEPE